MPTLNLEVHCPKCLDAHYHPLDLSMTVRGWTVIEDRCPYCKAALRVSYELRPHVKSVRLANGEYPVVLDTFADHHGTP